MSALPETVGLTTTVPVEVLFAAGRRPLDLNNRFITGPDPAADLERAERAGFPAAFCAWTKGIYGTLHRLGLSCVVAVTRGDCSEAEALAEVLASEGVRVIPFAYPRTAEPAAVAAAIAAFAAAVGVSVAAAEAQKERLDQARRSALELDRVAWQEGGVPGADLFAALINASDFCGDPEAHAARCRRLLEEAAARPAAPAGPRLGLVGIPPVFSDLIAVLEADGASVVYHEIPRQFALPAVGRPLAESYAAYTYPYPVAARLAEIEAEATRRRLDGLVHYVQSFCHRRLHDRLLRERLSLPILTLEGDQPGPVDARTRTRVEAFLEMLGA